MEMLTARVGGYVKNVEVAREYGSRGERMRRASVGGLVETFEQTAQEGALGQK